MGNEDLFTTFNFKVELKLVGESTIFCSAAFSDCSGLEMTMEPKTIREGGNNHRPIHLVGIVSYSQLTLKRGMTADFNLWQWFEQALTTGRQDARADGQVVMMASDGKTEQAIFELTGCLPIKIKAPALTAKDGQLAIEEMQIVYEMLSIKAPGGSGMGLGVSAGASAGIGAGISGGINAGISVNASVSVNI
jgi:phage tail-like protein